MVLLGLALVGSMVVRIMMIPTNVMDSTTTSPSLLDPSQISTMTREEEILPLNQLQNDDTKLTTITTQGKVGRTMFRKKNHDASKMDPKTKESDISVAEMVHVRENQGNKDLMKLLKPRDGEDARMFAAKVEFFLHNTIVGGRGPFPYYPNNDRNSVVDPNFNFTSFHALGGKRFEEYKHGDSPYDYEKGESDALARSRRYHVKRAMQFAWSNYQQYAFGKDEILPLTHASTDNWGGFGVTLVDSLDTLWLMNMTEEFYQARDWVESSLNHHKRHCVSVFETTIRSLGGLLSAFDWSGEDTFLVHAEDLGERLSKAFDSETGLPGSQVNLMSGKVKSRDINIAEVGTLQLEFRMLARLSGHLDYKEKSERVYDILLQMARSDGLYPYMIRNNGQVPKFTNNIITFGGMGDSFYEYMLKLWIQGGQMETKYREMYDKAIQSMHEKLLQVSTPSGLVFIAELSNEEVITKMDHLVCFMGGLLVLGGYTDPLGLESERAQRDIKTGKV